MKLLTPMEILLNEITNVPYMVRVPVLFTYTENELGKVGIPMEHDGITASVPDPYTPVVVGWSIRVMVEKFIAGCTIELLKPAEINRVYDNCELYLNKLVSAKRSRNRAFIVTDEDYQLEEFLNSIYLLNTKHIELNATIKNYRNNPVLGVGSFFKNDDLQDAVNLTMHTDTKRVNILPMQVKEDNSDLDIFKIL